MDCRSAEFIATIATPLSRTPLKMSGLRRLCGRIVGTVDVLPNGKCVGRSVNGGTGMVFDAFVPTGVTRTSPSVTPNLTRMPDITVDMVRRILRTQDITAMQCSSGTGKSMRAGRGACACDES